MKITIECEPRNGYTNISMFDPNGIITDWVKLDNIQNDTLEEIITYKTIDMICRDKMLLATTLTNWYNKMKVGGVFKLSVLNPYVFALMIKRGQLDISQIHQLIFRYGKMNGFISINNLKNILKNIGWKVDILSINELFITIESVK